MKNTKNYDTKITMNFMNNELSVYKEELVANNLYGQLEYEEQEKIENKLKSHIDTFTANIENILGSSYRGVKFELDYDERFRIYSELLVDSEYRGVIRCTKLLIIGTYQMFYNMDYTNIISDGKNVDNIKMILFDMAMMCLFYHELTHIYKGHLNLYSVWKKKELHYLDIQTLEWDADNYAATQMAGWISRIRKEILPLDETDFAMKMACGAIHGMMYWQRQETDFCDMEKKEHYPIFFREVTMLKCIGELCGGLENIMLYILGYEIEFNRMRRITSDEVKRYFEDSVGHEQNLKRIENNWEKVRTELEKYSIFPLDEM